MDEMNSSGHPHVTENNEYTLTPIKTPEKFNHEANFAHWDWDLTKKNIITNDDFDDNNLISTNVIHILYIYIVFCIVYGIIRK